MTAEQLILMLLQVVLFTSVLTLGFKSTLSEPFFLFRHPRLFIRTFIHYLYCGACFDCSNLSFSAAPCRCENRRDTLGDLTGCNNFATQYAHPGGKPALCLFHTYFYVSDGRGHDSHFPSHSDGSPSDA